MQFEQLQFLSQKNILAPRGFEPMTSALLVRCSTNWAMKPQIGSRSIVNLYTCDMNDNYVLMNISSAGVKGLSNDTKWQWLG